MSLLIHGSQEIENGLALKLTEGPFKDLAAETAGQQREASR